MSRDDITEVPRRALARGAEPARRRPHVRLVPLVVVVALVAASMVSSTSTAGASGALSGTVESGGTPLGGYAVTLLGTRPGAPPEVLGAATSAGDGGFTIDHVVAAEPDRVFYLLARSPGTGDVVLATMLGAEPGRVATVNPRTTVAFAYSTAQFLDGGLVVGPVPGVPNGASMAKNLADPVTGEIGTVLDQAPNGAETSSRATFNSLANAVAACVAASIDCGALRAATTPTDRPEPADSLQALRNLVRQPTLGVVDVYGIAGHGPAPYVPARELPPVAWTLALRFEGGTDLPDSSRMNGPGNFVMDHEGTMWAANNYTYAPPGQTACASDLVLRFAPDGAYVPGAPYRGGGLSGVGYGIARDRFGDIWLSNFGFAAEECDPQPPHNTLSRFTADGAPVSPAQGYLPDGVDWPQGIDFSPTGDLWIANCGNDSVTVLRDGDPARAQVLTGLGVEKPFDVAFGSDGNAYVTGLHSDNVAVVAPDGTPVPGSPLGGFHRPMGIAASSTGELWIASSGLVDMPCPGKAVEFVPPMSLGYIDPATGDRQTYTGGGLTIPWGVSVDGHDNVWVSDFGGERLTGFCGRDDSPHCPSGVGKGDPLSPHEGFFFDGLRRSTATATDSAGNVWVTNNWKELPPEANPGGYQVVVFLGLAGPVEVADPAPKPDPAPSGTDPTGAADGAVTTRPQYTG